RVEEEGVRAMLGTVGDDHLFALLDGLAAGDIHAMLAVARAMEERSLNFEAALQELATLFHRIALVQFAPDAILDDAERARLAPYAERLDPEFLQLCYQIVTHGRNDLALAPDEAAGFGMTLLRLHAFRPGGGEEKTARMASTTPALSRTPAVSMSVAVTPATPAAETAPCAESAAAAPDDWHALVEGSALTGMARQLAQHCELVERDGQRIVLRLDPAHRYLQMHQDKLRAELAKYFAHPLTLEIELGTPNGVTPKARAERLRRERQERAIAAIENDPFVREVCDLFDASIDESTIKPL
ncbi:MAG: DNA polymerase III subunit gamma/tau C-terminal domain-containing protein, partial [Rhodocyclaceae bacterium]